MATQIIWDEEPSAPEPKPELKEEWVPSPTSPIMMSPEAHRALFLGTVDIHELITELNKRGYVVHDSRGLYTPAAVTTSPYTPTITTTSGTYVTPTFTHTQYSIGGTYTDLAGKFTNVTGAIPVIK